jgi:hypothetical protein
MEKSYIEESTNSKYYKVDNNFQFPTDVYSDFNDPKKTIILIPDDFSVKDVHFNYGDAIPDASHGGFISAIIRSGIKKDDDTRVVNFDTFNIIAPLAI